MITAPVVEATVIPINAQISGAISIFNVFRASAIEKKADMRSQLQRTI
jgi:hypothetical protein